MAEYPTSIKYYADLDAGWTDITSYVIKNVPGGWGMGDNGPLDIIAETGYMNLTLNNADGKFSPLLATAFDGWGKGTGIKLQIVYEGETYTRFRGIVVAVDLDSGSKGNEKATAVVNDWMNYAAIHPLEGLTRVTDKRADELFTSILSELEVSPQNTEFDLGINTFDTGFDAVKGRTKAYTEMARIVISELGAAYLQKDQADGETLVLENAEHRHGWRELEEIPATGDDIEILLKEDGDYLLKEDGDKIVLANTTTFLADNNMLSLDLVYGENLINQFKAIGYPRLIDGSAVVLYSLESPIFIPSGVTITGVKGNYTDPEGGRECGGINMITPVINTDYKMWTNADGSGDDLTADLDIDVTYGVEGPEYEVTNNNAAHGWITHLQARGYGVYFYNPIERIIKDAASITTHDVSQKSIRQLYQQELTRGALAAAKYLELYKNPESRLRRVYFSANRSAELMIAFLNLDVGHLVNIKEDKTGIDVYAFIQGVEFEIRPGGIIDFAWIVKEFYCLNKGLSHMKLECRGSTNQDGVNFGYLPQISADGIYERTFSAMINLDAIPTAHDNMIMGPNAAGGGCLFYIDYEVGMGSNIYLTFECTLFDTASGKWRCPANAISLNTDTRVAVSYDKTDSTQNPTMYIDGVAQTVTEVDTPAGSLNSEEGAQFVIGNTKTTSRDYDRAFDGEIWDAQVHDAILTPSQHVSLAAETILSTNMLFQGLCVRDKDVDDLADQTLTSSDKLIDNMFGMVGSISGSPIAREV